MELIMSILDTFGAAKLLAFVSCPATGNGVNSLSAVESILLGSPLCNSTLLAGCYIALTALCRTKQAGIDTWIPA